MCSSGFSYIPDIVVTFFIFQIFLPAAWVNLPKLKSDFFRSAVCSYPVRRKLFIALLVGFVFSILAQEIYCIFWFIRQFSESYERYFLLNINVARSFLSGWNQRESPFYQDSLKWPHKKSSSKYALQTPKKNKTCYGSETIVIVFTLKFFFFLKSIYTLFL